jgi:hypothetical protein
VQSHLETFLALCHEDWEEERIAPHAERELRRYNVRLPLLNGSDDRRVAPTLLDLLISARHSLPFERFLNLGKERINNKLYKVTCSTPFRSRSCVLS